MIVFPTYEDGHVVRPYLFISGDLPKSFSETILNKTCKTASIVRLPSYDRLDAPVASHPDMLALPTPDGKICMFGEYAKSLPAALSDKIRTVDKVPDKKYPGDILLNFLIYKENIIGRVDMLPCELQGLELCQIAARQGYARCSVCLFGDHAITSDKGLFDILSSLGVNMLLISPTGISLPGYDRGFIGGATIVCEHNVFFFGDPLTHPDGTKMVDFIRSAGFLPISLGSMPLCDYGGGFLCCFN